MTKKREPVDDLELDLILGYLAVEMLLPPVLGQQHLWTEYLLLTDT
jgi:hypothetical protein